MILGAPPRPQGLFVGFTDLEPAYQAMAALVATARQLTELTMSGLRAVEWDIVVSKGVAVNEVPGHMHVLALGCRWVGSAKTDRNQYSVRYGGTQPSEVLQVADGLPDALRRLVVGELVPWLQAQTARPYLTISTFQGDSRGLAPPTGSPPTPGPSGSSLMPFVQDADGNIIAGAFERYGGGWCWALPHVPDHPELWLTAALDDWHQRTPDRVPVLPGWRSRPAWTTHQEVSALADLTALRDERDQVLAGLAEREDALLSAQGAATAAADAGPRRLLAAQGSKLVDAVIDALTTLGYEVENADDADADKGTPKVEDLRVSDPDASEWTNITEVRGYTGGAKASDLQRLGRFAVLYLQRTGALPASRWYVVNQFLNTDPDARRPPLAGGEDDLAVFAEDGGLVIDTRDLFHLAQRVESDTTSPAAARALLHHSTGVLQLPEDGTGFLA